MDEQKKQNPGNNCIALLRYSTSVLIQSPAILKPFIVLLFIQLLILEILYFAPRFPFSIFFGPIISKLWSETFLHYPVNFALLPKLFQYIQYPIYIFISFFIIGIAIKTIALINNGEDAKPWQAAKLTLKHYVHIVAAGILSFLLILALFKGYGLIFDRAMQIRSTAGKFYILKMIVVYGAPYFNLLLSIFVTTLLGYVLPIIVIENKKIFSALLENFKVVSKSFWQTFLIVFLPSICYVPVLLLRNSIVLENIMPELSILMLVLTIIFMVFIDAIVYTSLTALYLFKREDKQ